MLKSLKGLFWPPESRLTEAERRLRWERRAPGWTIRCRQCGKQEPFGKHGIRLFAASRKCAVLYCCPGCGTRGFGAVEKNKQ